MKRFCKIVALMMTFIIMCGIIPFDRNVIADDDKDVEDYVVRLYSVVLGREPDGTGLKGWTEDLKSGKRDASNVALGFFESPEYLSKQKDNDAYLKDLYKTFFDRTPDESGYSYWSVRLDAGMSRRNVLKGFTDSDEFKALCDSYKVNKGTVDKAGADETIYNAKIFADRLYKEALGRDPDPAGRDSWKNGLYDKSMNGATVAYGFIFSPECMAKTTDDTAFVKTLYRALMGREADQGGLNNWLNAIKGGMKREKVFEGFVNSAEFTAICAKFGIERGDYHFGRTIDPNKPMIALTFDDGPSTRTHEIVDCLEANHAVATFFVLGSNAQYYKELLKREDSLGIEIGNHTWNHPYLSRLGAEGVIEQISSTNAVVREATGHDCTVMRPPYGAHSDVSDANVGTPVILWSIDTRDWEHRSTQKTINNVLGSVRDGDIILMHDIHPSTVDAALYLIPELQRRGYQLVTVSELAEYRGGAAAGTVHSSFRR